MRLWVSKLGTWIDVVRAFWLYWEWEVDGNEWMQHAKVCEVGQRERRYCWRGKRSGDYDFQIGVSPAQTTVAIVRE